MLIVITLTLFFLCLCQLPRGSPDQEEGGRTGGVGAGAMDQPEAGRDVPKGNALQAQVKERACGIEETDIDGETRAEEAAPGRLGAIVAAIPEHQGRTGAAAKLGANSGGAIQSQQAACMIGSGVVSGMKRVLFNDWLTAGRMQCVRPHHSVHVRSSRVTSLGFASVSTRTILFKSTLLSALPLPPTGTPHHNPGMLLTEHITDRSSIIPVVVNVVLDRLSPPSIQSSSTSRQTQRNKRARELLRHHRSKMAQASAAKVVVHQSHGVRRFTVKNVAKLPAFCSATQDVSSGQIYLSGMTATIGAELRLVEGGVGPEVYQCLSNLVALAEACGSSAASFLKVNVFLKDNGPERFSEMNRYYVKFWSDQGVAPPARITVGCGVLALGAQVELDAIVASSPRSRL